MPEYADLVRDHHATVFRVALGVLRDPSLAEDVAQDVFLSFLDDPGALDRAENIRSFVCRTALNRALDVRKAGKRRAVRESAVHERRAEMSPVEAAFRSELRAKVAELPEDQRQAVDLHYFQGLTLREAGLALEIPEGTVSSRINTALGRLRAVLGAASFAGLLAMLDSELRKCAAEDQVPAGLSKRLLGLRPGAGSRAVAPAGGASSVPARAGAGRRRAAGVIVAAGSLIALLFLTRVLTRHFSSPEEQGDPHRTTEVAGNQVSPVGKTPVRATSAGAEDPVPPATKVLEMEGFIAESFEKGKPTLQPGRTPDPLTLQDLLEGPGGRIMDRQSAPLYFQSAGPIQDLPRGKFWSFAQWLDGNWNFDEAPRVWVKVQYEKIEKEPGSAALHCLKILERDDLSQAWLEAWRDLAQVNATLRDETAEAPGQEKRQRLLAVEADLAKAMAAAREARPKGVLAKWCQEREREWAAASAGILRRMGCGRELPAFPTEQQLTEIFLRAATPQSVREEVVSRFGEEALPETAFFVVPGEAENAGSFSPQWLSMAKIAALSVAEFDALRTKVASVTPEQRRQGAASAAGLHGREPGTSPRAEAMGIHGEQLEEFDAERLSLECGVEVKSVDAGSAAARAGIQVGDVLWKLIVLKGGGGPPPPVKPQAGDEKPPDAPAEVGELIQNPHWMDYLLEESEKVNGDRAVFAVVRNGEVVRVMVGE